MNNLCNINYHKLFSKNLRLVMKLTHKTQSDLVNDLDLHKSTISSWVLGERLPPLNKVYILAEYFGISTSTFYEEQNFLDMVLIQYLDALNKIYFKPIGWKLFIKEKPYKYYLISKNKQIKIYLKRSDLLYLLKRFYSNQIDIISKINLEK